MGWPLPQGLSATGFCDLSLLSPLLRCPAVLCLCLRPAGTSPSCPSCLHQCLSCPAMHVCRVCLHHRFLPLVAWLVLVALLLPVPLQPAPCLYVGAPVLSRVVTDDVLGQGEGDSSLQTHLDQSRPSSGSRTLAVNSWILPGRFPQIPGWFSFSRDACS